MTLLDKADHIDLIVDILHVHGVPEDAITRIERDARALYGGDFLYVAKASRRQRERRNERIRSEFDGRNHRDLAARFGVTHRTIRKIVR